MDASTGGGGPGRPPGGLPGLPSTSSEAQVISRLAQARENEGCGTLGTQAICCVGVFSLHKDGNVGEAMAGLSIRLSCLSNDVTTTRTGRLLISGGPSKNG